MARKKKRWSLRKQKVNGNVPTHVVYLERDFKTDDPPYARCTCGEFRTEPNADLMKLGLAAKAHALETGHRLRVHG